MYGTGNGGDKIMKALESFGVSLNGIFASPGFERDRFYGGFHVESYGSVRERYGDDIVVLLAFGTVLDEVRSFIETLGERHTLLVPDVPLYGGELFDEKYVSGHAAEIAAARKLFSERESIVLYDALLMFRLTGEYKYLMYFEETGETVRSLFGSRKIGNIIDLGAFRGDSAALFAESFEGVENIYAFEPDPKTFEKLSAFADNFYKCKIIPFNFAAQDCERTLTFSGSGSRGAGALGRNRRSRERTVAARAVDYFGFENVGFIKYDVEGDEAAALRGSALTIERCRPSLAVSLYHRTGDFFELPLTVEAMLGSGYTYYLRRPLCIPFWDLTLWAVKDV